MRVLAQRMPNKADSFCYVCGDFTTTAQRAITPLLRTAYFSYFGCKIGDHDKAWAPHICCKACYNGLTAWFSGKKASLSFAVPMVWREPRSHADDCYFCLTDITGFNASSRKIIYPNLPSALRPVPHSDDLPSPAPPVNKDLLPLSDEDMQSEDDHATPLATEDNISVYSGAGDNEPHWITQEDMNDLARDLYLSKQQSELSLKCAVAECCSKFTSSTLTLSSFRRIWELWAMSMERDQYFSSISFSASDQYSSIHFSDGEELPRQVEPQHDGGLLLDAAARYTRGEILQIVQESPLLSACCMG